jgi:hypothetical protein
LGVESQLRVDDHPILWAVDGWPLSVDIRRDDRLLTGAHPACGLWVCLGTGYGGSDTAIEEAAPDTGAA